MSRDVIQELPRRVRGDAAGELDAAWTPALAERYAGRIQSRRSRQTRNLESALSAGVVLSPVDLETLDCNLVGRDPHSGSCALDQNLVWRPGAKAPGHRTALAGLYRTGASTHPGPRPRRRLRHAGRAGAPPAGPGGEDPRARRSRLMPKQGRKRVAALASERLTRPGAPAIPHRRHAGPGAREGER